MFRRIHANVLAIMTAVSLLGWLAASGWFVEAFSQDKQQLASAETLPKPEQLFKGKIGRTAKDSTPDFPKPLAAPTGAPNVLLIMTDDVGYGAASTFGGPIPTPNFDKVAKAGLRFNNFHTTALCSPTRAALITDRKSVV